MDDSKKCGRKARSTGKPCQNVAGKKTSHLGTGACWLHGGADGAGGQEGNKHALTTGQYETIYVSTLNEGEKALYDSLDVNPRPQVEMDLKLCCIRIHRILLRILRAEEAADEDGMVISSITKEDGWDKGKKNNTKVEYVPVLTVVMALEAAVTAVQAVKARYIDQLRGVLKENPTDSGGLDAIVAAIDRSAQKIAVQREQRGAPDEHVTSPAGDR